MDKVPGIEAEDLLTHLDWLGALARQLVGDQDRAKDLVQDACLVALQRRPADPEGVRGWLAQILRNLHRQGVRTQGRARTRDSLHAQVELSEATDRIAERVALQRELARFVLELEEPGRTVILLRFYSSLPPREIASRLGVSVSVVHGRLHRALARLRERLGSESKWTMPALAALLLDPFAKLAVEGQTRLVPLGALTMAVGAGVSSGLKLAAAAALVLLLGLSAWLNLPVAPSAPSDAQPNSGEAELTSPVASRPSVADERKQLDLSGQADGPASGTGLEPTSSRVTLLVTDLEHQPVAGVEVEVLGSVAQGHFQGDDKGICALPVEPGTGGLEIRIAAPGFVTEHRRVSCAERERIVLRRAADIAGRIVREEDGSPVADAEVSLVDYGGLYPTASPTTVSDGSGRFLLQGIPLETTRWWRVRAEGFATLMREIEVRDPSLEIELPLVRGVPIELQVEDALSNEPLAGAAISSKGTSVETDALGRASTSAMLSIGEAETALEISAPGYCTLHAEIQSSEIQPGVPVRLPLLAAVRLQCTVVDAVGNGAPGVSVHLQEDRLARRKAAEGTGAADLVDLPQGWSMDGAYFLEALTDEHGQLEMNGLVPLSRWYQVRVRAAEAWLTESQALPPLGNPGTTTRFEIVLPSDSNCAIVGTMLLNERPVAGAIRWQGPSRTGNVMVGPNGNYRIEGIPPGRFTLMPRPDGKLPFSKCGDLLAGPWLVDVERGQETHYDIALQLEMAAVSGRVVDANGTPQPGLVVQARSEEGCWFDGEYSGEDGSFDLSVRAGPWPYALRAGNFPDIAELDAVLAGTQNLELVLPGTGTLKLRVVDRGTRVPLSGFLLCLQGDDGHQLSLNDAVDSAFSPDPQGWFQTRLRSGNWHVFVFDDLGKASGYLPIDGGSVLIRTDAGPVELELERERGLELDLHLADDQAPWPATSTVFLLESDRTGDLKPAAKGWDIGPGYRGLNVVDARKVEPDSNGHAHVRSLRPGRCRFVAFPGTVSIEPAEIVVTDRETGPIEIRWSPR
jgi:RNA polymerase sigma factor (sigma-70 family)